MKETWEVGDRLIYSGVEDTVYEIVEKIHKIEYHIKEIKICGKNIRRGNIYNVGDPTEHWEEVRG